MKNFLYIAGAILLSVPFEAGATDQVMRLALLSSSAQSTLYKWNDRDGRIHYSDKPPVGANRAYETSVAPAKGTISIIENKAAPEYSPLPHVAQSLTTAPGQKPKPDLTANLVWFDTDVR